MGALITEDGVVTRWPSKVADKTLVLDFLAPCDAEEDDWDLI